MAELKEARVPDIGGYDDVPVIEVLVAVGDTVKADQGLVTLESDKATMEVPAPFAGVVRDLKVKLGDTLSEGSVVAVIESDAAGPASPATAGEGRDGGKPASTGSPSRESEAPPSQPSPAAQGKEPQAPAPQGSHRALCPAIRNRHRSACLPMRSPPRRRAPHSCRSMPA